MTFDHHHQHHQHQQHSHMIQARDIYQRPGPIPEVRLEALVQRRDASLVARAPSPTSSSSDSTVSCGPKDTTGYCQRSVGASSNETTLPIILGVVIPLSVAFVVLVYLHRRHVRKLRQEDAEDKHKSLDFGMAGAVRAEKKRKNRGNPGKPEMEIIDPLGQMRKDRGLSMDIHLGNPYILPPELQQSRESLHSLSRTMNTGDDKYRATTFIPDDGSLRSPSSLRYNDDASIYTSSSRPRTETGSTRGLLPPGYSPSGQPLPTIQKPAPVAKDNKNLLAPAGPDGTRESYVSTTSSNGNVAALRASNNYLGQFISGGAKKDDKAQKGADSNVAELVGDAPREEVVEPPAVAMKDGTQTRTSIVPAADAGFNFDIPANTYELSSGPEPTLPQFDVPSARHPNDQVHEAPGHDVPRHEVSELDSGYGSPTGKDAMNTQGADKEHATPQIQVQSANENEYDYYEDEEESYDINDYKDVLGYDPRLLTMGMRPLPPDDPSENPEERALKIRSFYKEYFDETAKPGGDKARMSYFDASDNYIDDYYGSYAPSTYGPRGAPGRHRATMSNASYGPRAYSSASQRMHGQRMAGKPKKNRPPPTPLQALPTPYKLKDDSMLPNAIDYAPPQLFKNQRAGTPDNLRGGLRPYSPSTRAYNPLVSSFDDLSVLPSPHHLRKSGAFTALDFAPPRFVGPAGGSDAGSIRSNRSGTSAMQLHNIRAGAYRISRIPKEVAGTRDELAAALRPQWNAR